jgi:hypothetical protein
VRGGTGIPGFPAIVIPRNWLATAFLGLSGVGDCGLPLGGVQVSWRMVLSGGTSGRLSRLRLGDGLTADSCVGGMAQ